MSMYNVINSVLFKRKIEGYMIEEFYSGFMLNRWFSMYDPSVIPLSNELNKVLSVFTDKKQGYDFAFNVIPKLPFKRISYIKKGKRRNKTKADEKKDLEISHISKKYEISQKEAKEYIEMLGILSI